MIAEALQAQGYALGQMFNSIQYDESVLFIVPSEHQQELEALSAKHGDIINFDFGWLCGQNISEKGCIFASTVV